MEQVISQILLSTPHLQSASLSLEIEEKLRERYEITQQLMRGTAADLKKLHLFDPSIKPYIRAGFADAHLGIHLAGPIIPEKKYNTIYVALLS